MRSLAAPPFPVGAQVRYTGHSWRREDGPWVNSGDVGVVVRVVEAQAGSGAYILPDEGEPYLDEGDHGYSVVQFHGSPRTEAAVDGSVLTMQSGRYVPAQNHP